MRILKTIMFLMIAMVVLALGLVGYFYATAKVTIAAYNAEGVQASTRAELFEQIKAQAAQNTFQGTLFTDTPLGEVTDYAFITYTLRLNNQSLIPLDMIEVQVEPDTRDVLQLGDGKVHSLDVKAQGDISATILTAADSHAIREVVVTYYVWGVSFSIRQTLGG